MSRGLGHLVNEHLTPHTSLLGAEPGSGGAPSQASEEPAQRSLEETPQGNLLASPEVSYR